MKRILIIVVLLVALVPLAGCAAGCSAAAKTRGYDALKDVTETFYDKLDIASNTPRAALGPAISELQDIRNEAEDVEVPGCMETAKTEVVAHMNEEIEASLAFMGDDDAGLTEHWRASFEHVDAAYIELEALDLDPSFLMTSR
jgi:hypothetical protein